MGKCDHCHEQEPMPFICPSCGGSFCLKHRFPENHNCKQRKKHKKTSYKKAKQIKQQNIAKLQTNSTSKKKQKPSSTRIIVLIILCISGLAFCWTKAFDYGYAISYNQEHTNGQNLGFNIGYAQGYEEGYNSGNTSGIQSGYSIGYETGETDGNQYGFNEGKNEGVNNGFIDGNNTKYTQFYQEGFQTIQNRVFNVSNPTYYQVKDFLRRDRTDREQYILGDFVCEDFAYTVKNNAFKENIRCIYVSIAYQAPPGHAIIAFNTTDRGLIFFEPQSDTQVTVEIGTSYSKENGFTSQGDDIITEINMVW